MSVRPYLLSAGILAAAFGFALAPNTGWAQACGEERDSGDGMNEPVFRAVEQANKAITENRYNDAITALKKMVGGKISNYERAVIYYNLGYAYNLKEDLSNAVKAFQMAIDANALPQAQHEQLLFNTGQLYVLNKELSKGIATMERYLLEACNTVPADAHVFLASAYVEKGRNRDALRQINLALAKTSKPKESWLQTKLAIHYELKEYKACTDTLVQLIGMAPNKSTYWKQLSSMFLQLNDDSEAAAVLALAERQGFVESANDIRNMYSMYMMIDAPFKAGKYYEAAMRAGRISRSERNLNDLANAWINAREYDKAESVLVNLADSSGKASYYYKLGAMYGDDERWDDSIKMLRQAVNAGGLTNNQMGESYIRLALAYYSQQNLSGAESALQRAVRYDRYRLQASQWLSHIRSQM